jgi:hypothetical protein
VDDEDRLMVSLFGILWIIAAFAAVITFLDNRSRRRDRDSRNKPA